MEARLQTAAFAIAADGGTSTASLLQSVACRSQVGSFLRRLFSRSRAQSRRYGPETMRPINRILINKDVLTETGARNRQCLEAWRTGIPHGVSPSA
jgi:hypothetical protein